MLNVVGSKLYLWFNGCTIPRITESFKAGDLFLKHKLCLGYFRFQTEDFGWEGFGELCLYFGIYLRFKKIYIYEGLT